MIWLARVEVVCLIIKGSLSPILESANSVMEFEARVFFHLWFKDIIIILIYSLLPSVYNSPFIK